MSNKPFIISISATSGGGKTTVTNELAKRLDNVAVISFDSYKEIFLGRDYCEWSEDGADANEWHLDSLIIDIQKLIIENPKYIIIDYPFGRSNKKVDQFIDFAVFIDVPYDVALGRRIIRDYCRRDSGRKKIDNPIEALYKSLTFYLERKRSTYFQHVKTVEPYCDLTIDGTRSKEDIAADIMSALAVYKM